MNPWLTLSSHKMLKAMRDGKDKSAAVEGSQVWVDYFQFSKSTFTHLLRLCLIRQDSYSGDKCETWLLNEDGLKIIDDVTFEPPIIAILQNERKNRKAKNKKGLI